MDSKRASSPLLQKKRNDKTETIFGTSDHKPPDQVTMDMPRGCVTSGLESNQHRQHGNIVELESRLRRCVASTLGLHIGCISPTTRFVEDLGLGVLDAIEIVLSLETLLDFQLPDRDAAQVNCVKDFVDAYRQIVDH